MSDQINNNTVFVQSYNQPRPSRFAHGWKYWVFIGWWWATIKWIFRVALWLLILPVGVWRSYVHHDNKKQARIRRGYSHR